MILFIPPILTTLSLSFSLSISLSQTFSLSFSQTYTLSLLYTQAHTLYFPLSLSKTKTPFSHTPIYIHTYTH